MSVTATIQELLQGIMDSQYGRDMRQFIHDAIQKCYEEGSAGETDLVARESIEKILDVFGDVESGDTASKDYAVGDSVVYDGRLYKVIVAIEEGDTFAEGTNIEESRATSNVGDLYELPFWTGGTGNKSKLYIIPSIKLMIFNINQTFATNESPAFIGMYVPVCAGIQSLLFKTFSFPIVWKATDNSNDYLIGEAEYSHSHTDPDNNAIQISCFGTRTKEMTVKGTVIAPYLRLNSQYPFSDATLVTL